MRFHQNAPASTCLLAWLAATLAGCGNNVGTAPDATTDALDAAADAAVDASADVAADVPRTGQRVTVIVVEATNPAIPVNGAQVALDFPGGGREQQTTGPDGTVVFAGVDFARGTATVTAFAGLHGLRSVAGIRQATEPVRLALWSGNVPGPPEPVRVHVRGAIRLLDPTDHFVVTNALAGGLTDTTGGTYDLSVPAGVPIHLVALEYTAGAEVPAGSPWVQPYRRWVGMDHEAITADTTIDIDFATTPRLEPTRVTGTVRMGATAAALTGVFGAWPGNDLRIEVRSLASGSRDFLGGATRVAPNSNGTDMDFDFEYVRPGPEADAHPVTCFYVGAYNTGSTLHCEAGYPADGAQITGIMLPPTIVTPAPRVVPSVFAPMQIEHHSPPGDVLRAEIDVLVHGADPTWAVDLPPDATTIALPRLTSGAGNPVGQNADWISTRFRVDRGALDPARLPYDRALTRIFGVVFR